MLPNDNTLIRSVACERCDAPMLWTQAAWADGTTVAGAPVTRAAYRCLNGHVLDPADTPQCPACGIHDTARAESVDEFRCRRCHAAFSVPR
jgi:hypothetical protein